MQETTRRSLVVARVGVVTVAFRTIFPMHASNALIYAIDDVILGS